MEFMKSLFGPSKKDSWFKFATEIGANYVDGGTWSKDQFIFRYKNWDFDFHTYTQSSGKSSTTNTRLRVPFLTKDKMQFNIYEEGFFSTFGKLFNMQDIQIGNVAFNDKYIIKGNNEMKIMQLLSEPSLRRAFMVLEGANVKIDTGEGLFRKGFPEGVYMLEFTCIGIIKKNENLHSLFKLFQELLGGLVRINSIERDNPVFKMK